MEMIHIGCKLPHGFIMELIEAGPMLMPTLVPGKRVTISGANSLKVHLSSPNPGEHRYAVTMVEEEFALKWFEANKTLPFVKNGQVFVEKKEGEARAHARANETVKTGIEPIDPTKPPKGIEVLKKEAA